MSLFILFGVLALVAAVTMVVQRNAVHGALLLVLHFFAIAMLFLTLGAEFLAVSQIIVYAGAIMVLFLFVIMLLGVDRLETLMEPRRLQRRQVAAGLVIGLVLLAGLISVVAVPRLVADFAPVPAGFGSAEAIGRLLFTDYVLAFQVAGLLLLVAAVGVLLIAIRTRTRA